MKRLPSILLVLVGVMLAGVSQFILPPDQGRLGFLIEIAAPNDLRANMPDELMQLHAMHAVVFTNPQAKSTLQKILLFPAFSEKITRADCAIGSPAKAGDENGYAGVHSGVHRGKITLAGKVITVGAELRLLGPRFDDALVMDDTARWRHTFRTHGWGRERLYLILAKNYPEQQWLLAALDKLSAAKGRSWGPVTAHGFQSPLSRLTVFLLGLLAVAIGAVMVVKQLRSITTGEIAARFERNS